MKKNYPWILIAYVLLLVACGTQSLDNLPASSLPVDEYCIDTFDNFAFTIPNLDGLTQTKILPQDPWVVEAALPAMEFMGLSTVEIVRSVNDHSEIWIKKFPYTYSSDIKSSQYLVYRPDTKEWESISAQIGGSNAIVDHLYVTPDGSIWGLNIWVYDSDSAHFSSLPALSRYNDVMGYFEIEQTTSEIPYRWIDLNSDTTNYPRQDKVSVDSNGIFWIFVSGDYIYSYNSTTQEVTRHNSISQYQSIGEIVLAPDNSIYFTQRLMVKTLKADQILHFVPDTRSITAITIPDVTWLTPVNILIDHTGRLWVDAFGWREIDGSWYTLNPRMDEFVKKIAGQDLWTVYYPPGVVMESTDERIWFKMGKMDRNIRSGMAWLDPKSMKGCWFTSETADIEEDKDNNLWMVIEGKLYKYSLTPVP